MASIFFSILHFLLLFNSDVIIFETREQFSFNNLSHGINNVDFPRLLNEWNSFYIHIHFFRNPQCNLNYILVWSIILIDSQIIDWICSLICKSNIAETYNSKIYWLKLIVRKRNLIQEHNIERQIFNLEN